MSENSHLEQRIKDYILLEFLPGEDPEQLTSSTPLISAGILDSIATLQLISFLEQEFSIALAPHEADAEHLDTIQRIVKLILGKTAARS